MTDRRRLAGWLAAMAVTVPLLLLPLRAAADVWRAPALWPQQLGTRALDVVTDPRSGVLDALGTSVIVAVGATVAAILVGWPAARLLAAGDRRARAVVLVGVLLPLLVPPFAVGFGLNTWLLRLGLAGTTPGLIVSHLTYVVPYVVLVLVPGFSRAALELDEAAATLGAGWWTRTRLVTLPALAPALAVAGLLGFVVSWGQYGTSLAVGGGRLTLPLVLLPFVGTDAQVAAALTLVFLVPPVAALAVATRRLPAGSVA